MENLLTKINSGFTLLKTKAGGLSTSHDNTVKKLETEVENAPNAPKEMVDGLKQTASKLNSDIQELIREIDDSVTEKEMFRNFNYWCLFSCLYSIMMLILNGFDFNFDTPNKTEGFIILNIFAILLVLWIIRTKSGKYFKKYASASFIGIIICFFICITLYYLYYSWDRRIIWEEWGGENVAIILALLLPTGHFIFYFFKSTIISRATANRLNTSHDNLRSRTEDFSKKIDTAFEVIMTVEREKQNNGEHK